MSNSGSSEIRFSLGKEHFLPQEEMLEVEKKKKRLVIGIPKENHKLESRVALTPEAVDKLVGDGHEVIIESKAGQAAKYLDTTTARWEG